MEENEVNTNKARKGLYGRTDWRPIIIFYVRTTSWIIVPLIAGILASKYLGSAWFLPVIVIAFGLTCYGIYGEIKKYKKELNNKK